MQKRTKRKQTPRRIVIYGQQGVGKSSLAACFPDAVFIDCEGSTENMDVPAYDCASIGDVQKALKLAIASTHRTIVVDTFDWCEHAIAADMLAQDEKKSLEDYGFGKGYNKLGEEVMEFLSLLDGARTAGKHVVLLAHSKIEKFTPPDAAEGYHRWQMKLSKQSEPLVMEWADAILFMHYEVKTAKKENRTRAVGGKDRILRTQHCATANAKNRFGWAELLDVELGELPAPIAAILERPVTAEARADGSMSEAMAKQTGANVSVIAAEALDKMREAIKGKEALVKRFLIGGGHIKDGQDVDALPADYIKRVLRNPPRFLEAVAEDAAANGYAEAAAPVAEKAAEVDAPAKAEETPAPDASRAE